MGHSTPWHTFSTTQSGTSADICIPPCTTHVITIAATVSPTAACGSITNTATITLTDIALPNNTINASFNQQIICPNLSLTKSVSQSGNNVTFTISVKNIGSAPATGVTVEDCLNSFLPIKSVKGTNWTISRNGNSFIATYQLPLARAKQLRP